MAAQPQEESTTEDEDPILHPAPLPNHPTPFHHHDDLEQLTSHDPSSLQPHGQTAMLYHIPDLSTFFEFFLPAFTANLSPLEPAMDSNRSSPASVSFTVTVTLTSLAGESTEIVIRGFEDDMARY